MCVFFCRKRKAIIYITFDGTQFEKAQLAYVMPITIKYATNLNFLPLLLYRQAGA